MEMHRPPDQRRSASERLAPPKALTIAGSDSGGCAGIQADLRTFAALGVHGSSAITALTAQNTIAVLSSFVVPPWFVAAQIDAVMVDIGAAAAKTGMLASREIIEVVADRVVHHRIKALVVDPVMVATSGARLIHEDAVESLVRLLFPNSLLVTPNLVEAQVLTGMELTSPSQVKEAARRIHGCGAPAVLIKGGHSEDPAQSVDLLFDGTDFHRLVADRVATGNTHGSGCTLAAAVAAFLARGEPLAAACSKAKRFVTSALLHSYPVGAGSGPLGQIPLRG